MSDSVTLLENLKVLVEACEKDYGKAKNGNKAAGTRIRKEMQKVRDAAKAVRKEMMELRKIPKNASTS